MQQTSKLSKNGEIEFFRLVFALSVVGVHLNGFFHLDLFQRGAFGVEFFFLVSGYFMARSAERTAELDMAAVCGFLKRKVFGFLPYYAGAVLIQLVALRICLQRVDLHWLVTNAVKFIPELLFLQMGGFATESAINVAAVWYLSALLLALLLLYPIAVRYKKTYGVIFLPLAIFSIGYLNRLHGGYLVVFRTQDSGLFYDGMLRAIGEVALGAACYQLGGCLRGKSLSRVEKIGLTLFKFAGYTAFAAYTFSSFSREYEAPMLILLTVCFLLTGSEITYNIPYNGVTAFCGAISLPLYLFHAVLLRCIVVFWDSGVPTTPQLLLIVLGILLFSLLCKSLCDLCQNGLRRLRQRASAQ